MPLPAVTADDVRAMFPTVRDVGARLCGGQKVVFPCTVAGRQFALKILLATSPEQVAGAERTPIVDEVMARARREFAILRACNSPHLPRIGPIDLCVIERNGQHLIAFSEEYIVGESLQTILQGTPRLPAMDIRRLARHVNFAITELWAHRTIHRDIKPANIMRRTADGSFVLLDAGIAFALDETTITQIGHMVRTLGFVAPELLRPNGRREADYRADHFLLGIVLYIAATGHHPFIPQLGMREAEINRHILDHVPPAPHTVRRGFPRNLSDVIVRLLQKRGHARFRTCAHLETQLAACGQG